nr:hypothetical protein [Tanacetum cinerariifolium]
RDVGYNGNKTKDNGRRPAYQDDLKDLVTIDGDDIDWSGHVDEDAQNYAMMTYSANNSGSDNEVKSCSKACEESYARLKKLYDDQRDKLGDASIEIIAYTLALKKTSANEADSKPSEYASCESDSSVETSTSMPEPVENASKVFCEPKVWTDAPIIKEYESDSDNGSVSNVQEDKEKPSFAFTDSVKHDDPHRALKDKGIVDSCSRHMTGNKAHLEQMTQLTSMCEMFCQFVQKKREEKRIEEELAEKAQTWKLPVFYDDDDDEERSHSLQDNIIFGLPPCSAITPNEPIDSLSMGEEHLNIIPAMESDEFIKSCVENLVPNPSEFEGKNEYDVPASLTTFSNILFDAEYEFNSIDPHHFDTESDLIESMRNRDSSIISSSLKIDSLLNEFTGKLTLLKSIPSGIDETDCDPEDDIRLIKRLLYDNSSPRLPKEFVSENSNADIESFSLSPIPVEDSNSFMEEIALTTRCNAIFLAVASLFFWQWHSSSLAVGTSSASRNSIPGNDNIISGLPPFSAITPDEPVLSTEEPDNSLNQIEDFSESNEEFSSIDDNSFSIDDIDYVEASP